MTILFTYLNPHTALFKDNRKLKNIDEDVEELDDELDDTEEEDENTKPPKKKTQQEEETEEDDDDSGEEEIDDDEDEEEEEDDDSEEEEQKKQLLLKKQQEEDKRKKELAESKREALIQNARNKQLTEKINLAKNLSVTDADIKSEAEKEGLDFDTLEPFQKTMLKRTILAERRFDTVSEVVVEDNKVTEYLGKVDEFLEQQDTQRSFPRLAGHEDAFKAFAVKPTRRGLDFEDLATLFLANVPLTKKRMKGSLLPRGGGGEKIKKKGLSEDDVIAIRKSNPRKYMDLVKNGKINIEV
jgi:hypothetical protein